MQEGKLRHLQPDFYEGFRCRASACRHSCCRGWEIDIDENTLELYQNLSGEWREKMDAAIVCDDSGAHFRLTEDERCPFLRQDGLCELICAFGEDALCDICALHPRFYELVGSYELAGLGLSCEAVCDLLLAEEGELTLKCEETGEMIAFSWLLKSLGCENLEGALHFTPTEDLDGLLLRMERTEPIDAAWTEELDRLRKALKAGAKPELPTGPRYDRMLAFCRRENHWGAYSRLSETLQAEEFCNMALTLCHITDKMFDGYLRHLEKTFREQGGIRERMYAVRTGYRQQQDAHLQFLEAENRELKAEVGRLKSLLARLTGEQRGEEGKEE